MCIRYCWDFLSIAALSSFNSSVLPCNLYGQVEALVKAFVEASGPQKCSSFQTQKPKRPVSCRMKLLMNLMKPYIAHDETIWNHASNVSLSQHIPATNGNQCIAKCLCQRILALPTQGFAKFPDLLAGKSRISQQRHNGKNPCREGLCGEIALWNAMGSSHTQVTLVTLVTVTNQVFQKATLPLYGVLQRPDHTLDGFSGFIVLPKRGGIRWNSQCFMVVFTV